MEKKTNSVWYVVIALTIWCVWNSVGCNKFTSALSEIQTQQNAVASNLAYLMDKVHALEEIEPQVIVKEVEVIKEVRIEVPAELPVEVPAVEEVDTDEQ